MRFTALLAASAVVFSSTAAAQVAGGDVVRDPRSPVPEIPYKMFTLKNGLTLIVHEDHKAPIAAVNVWYHVGSKNERVGKTGFAHLFEHLMFNGSENYNDDYRSEERRVGKECRSRWEPQRCTQHDHDAG